LHFKLNGYEAKMTHELKPEPRRWRAMRCLAALLGGSASTDASAQ
jgi:hypothetical protein